MSLLAPAKLTEASASANAEGPADPDKIIGAIDSLRKDFGTRLDGLLNAIKGVQGDLNILTTRLTEAEDRISTNEDDVASLKAQNS